MNPQIIRYGVAAGIGLVAGAFGGYVGGVLRTRKIYMQVVEKELAAQHALNHKERQELMRYRTDRYGATPVEEIDLESVNATVNSELLITDADLASMEDGGLSIEGTIVENVSVAEIRRLMNGKSSISLEDLKAHMSEQGVTHFAVEEDEVGVATPHRFEVDQAEYQAQRPRHISIEQYMDDDEGAGFAKVVLTYFELDGILATEDQITIDDIDMVIGVEHLEKFGELSDDKDDVYVRNVKESVDYQITRRVSSYQVEILNKTPEEAGLTGFNPAGRRDNG